MELVITVLPAYRACLVWRAYTSSCKDQSFITQKTDKFSIACTYCPIKSIKYFTFEWSAAWGAPVEKPLGTLCLSVHSVTMGVARVWWVTMVMKQLYLINLFQVRSSLWQSMTNPGQKGDRNVNDHGWNLEVSHTACQETMQAKETVCCGSKANVQCRGVRVKYQVSWKDTWIERRSSMTRGKGSLRCYARSTCCCFCRGLLHWSLSTLIWINGSTSSQCKRQSKRSETVGRRFTILLLQLALWPWVHVLSVAANSLWPQKLGTLQELTLIASAIADQLGVDVQSLYRLTGPVDGLQTEADIVMDVRSGEDWYSSFWYLVMQHSSSIGFRDKHYRVVEWKSVGVQAGFFVWSVQWVQVLTVSVQEFFSSLNDAFEARIVPSIMWPGDAICWCLFSSKQRDISMSLRW